LIRLFFADQIGQKMGSLGGVGSISAAIEHFSEAGDYEA
jgi:hypothetical protein